MVLSVVLEELRLCAAARAAATTGLNLFGDNIHPQIGH
jgi:hypothetical protein